MILNKNMPPVKVLSLFFTLSLGYAVVRYHLFGGVLWDQLPLYVMNKVLALTVVLVLFYKIWFGRVLTAENKEWYIWAIATLVFGHVLISLSLLSPEYYAKFFTAGKMHFKNELSILFGIAAFIAFLGFLLSFTKENKKLARKFQQVILFLLAVHLFSMGLSGWITPWKWYGAMPPVSLLSFVIILSILFVKKKI